MQSFLPVMSNRKCASPPRTPVSHSSSMSPLATAGWGEGGAAVSKHGAFLLRTPHLSQAAELYYQEPHPLQEPAHFQTSCESALGSCDFHQS